MGSPIAVFDDHSPGLDSLLEWLILDKHGLASPNPSESEVELSRDLVNNQMPLTQGSTGGDWYWQTSGPAYCYHTEQESRYRKRWQPGHDSPVPNWGSRKAKWNTSAGSEKSYDLPVYLRLTDRIDWYCNGDPEGIEHLLLGCAGLGKKRSQGHGQVISWEVTEIESDWHLYREGSLMRPIPVEWVDRPCEFAVRQWGWRPPAWLPANSRRCAMPINTVRLVAG